MAADDLDAIIDYIARDNPRRAEAFGQELQEKTMALAHHARLGRAGRPGLPIGVRELVVHRNYIVLYRVRQAERVIEILRVKHASQQ
ncbi:MAG: type II toxin-antitoxin system RelE/ParE family toxin, partial [Casimicrobiaceae bacterium]